MMHREFWTSDGQFRVRVPLSVLDNIDQMSQEAHPYETGGILIGKYSDDRRLAAVTSATPPPQGSRSHRFRFRRGVGRLNQLLRSLWKKTDRQYYLGEWHYHPASRIVPSNQDIKQLSEIANDGRYQCPEPIMLIAGIPARPTPLHLEIATSSGKRLILYEQDS